MKRIEVIVPDPSKSRVIRALEEMNLHYTHYDTKGRGKTQPSVVEVGRGTSTLSEEYTENVTIMDVVSDAIVDKVVEKISNSIHDSEGIIFVYEVKDAIDIRTKKHGDSVL
jgi:nitrogen regulatory protein PII